jgi:sec-independent protein translocase protein TatA
MPFGPLEILLLVFLFLLFFGARRLPEMGRGLGQSLRGFRHELSSGLKEDETEPEERREREVTTPRVAERH